MDAFYASVEQRDCPELRGKPIAVGGSKDRGVVAAASYEARKFGVKSAMPSVIAKRLCPDLIFVRPRFDVYKSVSHEIREIFHRYTDLIEPLSLDEAYLDVTENKIGLPSATGIAKSIKAAIAEELNLVASAGVSYNKFLAKIASDEDKPNGLYVITPDASEDFINKLPIRKFFGVGKVTAEKMNGFGIFFGKDLKRHSPEQLTNWFGKSGGYFYNIAHGIDDRAVNANRIRKSLGVERTLESDVTDGSKLKAIVRDLSKKAFERCTRSNKFGKSVTLKIKFNDFTQITRSKTSLTPMSGLKDIEELTLALLDIEHQLKPVRLMGVTLSNFPDVNEAIQLTLEF